MKNLSSMEQVKTPRGIRNNNPLNIRKGSAWQGLATVQSDPSFCVFKSMVYGLRAAHKLLRNYITGSDGRVKPADTISTIIMKWAPPSENATQKYIEFVANETGLSPFERIHFLNRKTMCDLVAAMAFVECGQRIDRKLIESAYDMLN